MEAVIFIGVQGSGKSSFYIQNFFRTHLRINLDMLRTRHREKLIFDACLAAKLNFVIDNTNPTVADRCRYIQETKEAGFEVVGYYFQSRLEDCLARNAARSESERVPDLAIRGTLGKLEIPRIEEGFDRLYYVRLLGAGQFQVEDWQDEV